MPNYRLQLILSLVGYYATFATSPAPLRHDLRIRNPRPRTELPRHGLDVLILLQLTTFTAS
jgi:hypothetical protein